MKFFSKFFSKKRDPLRRDVPRFNFIKDTPTGDVAKARKFWEENPMTVKMWEELKKGNPVRVDAGRKENRSS